MTKEAVSTDYYGEQAGLEEQCPPPKPPKNPPGPAPAPKPKFYEFWKAATYEDPTTAPVAVVLLVMVFVVVVSIPALILYRPKAKARKRLDESRGRPPNPPRFL